MPLFKFIPRIQQYLQQKLFVRYSSLLTTSMQATFVHYSSQTAIRYSAHNLFVSANLYSFDLPNLQTRNLFQHNADGNTSYLLIALPCPFLVKHI